MKKLYWMSIIGFVLIIVFWILGYYFAEYQFEPHKFVCRGDENEAIKRLDIVYVSLGALFTALAFGGAILSIVYQRITTLRATSLEVFTRVYNAMQNEPKFKETFRYISEILSKEEEYSKPIDELKKDKITWYKDNNPQEISKYNAIVYFCDRMDYIGLLIKQNYVDIVLLYPTGGEYVNAFNVLNEHFFTNKERKRYIHFRYLIYWMQKKNNKYNKYTYRIERDIARFEYRKTKTSFLQKWVNKLLKRSCDTCKHYEHKDN